MHLRIGSAGSARAQIRLGGGAVGPGTYLFAVKGVDEAAEAVRLSFADGVFDLSPGLAREIEVRLTHAGGPLELALAVTGPPGASVWLTEARVVAFIP